VHVGQPGAPTRAAASPVLPKPLPSGFGRLSIPSTPMPYVDEARRERAKVQGEGALRSWRQRVKSAQDTKDLEPTQAEQRAIDSARAAKKEEQTQQHPYSGAVGMLHEAQQGDTQAQKALADAVRPAMQQRKDALDYAQATGGEMLRNGVEIGMTLDHDGNVVGAPMYAPTVARDAKGDMILGDDGKPLVGMTSEQAARNTYKSGMEDAVEAEKRRRAEEQAQKEALDLDKATEDMKRIEDEMKDVSMGSEEYWMLRAARNAAEDRIKDIKAARDDQNGTFLGGLWRGFRDSAFDISNWNWGFTDTYESVAKERARVNELLGESTRASQELAQQSYGADMAAAQKERSVGNGYAWGQIGGQSAPFAVDFLIGNELGVIKGVQGAVTRTVGRIGTKVGQEAVKGLSRFGVDVGRRMTQLGKAVVKNTGIAMGDVAASGALSTTIQAPRTGADILSRYTGNATFDPETGKYHFEGGETIGTAIYKGLANSVVENYTEMLGAHLNLGPAANNLLSKVGLKRGSEMIARMTSTDAYKAVSKMMQKAGYNGYLGEVIEEEVGIPLHALTDGSNKMSDLIDPEQQKDIVGGMAFSMGITGGAMVTVHGAAKGAAAAMYYRDKHKLGTLDKVARYRMTPETWAPIKEALDNAENKDLQAVFNREVMDNGGLSAQGKEAAWQYAQRLILMRGHNIGQQMGAAAAAKDGKGGDGGADRAYAEGYNAVDGAADEHGIKVAYEQARDGVAGMYGEQFADQLDEDPVSTIETLEDGSKGQALASEYLRAKVAYEGMIQRAQDDMEDHVQEVTQQVERRVNTTEQGGDGMIHRATLKQKNADGTEHHVYVVNSTVQMTADGKMVDKTRSSASVVVYDPDTGKMEMLSPESIFTVDEAVDPTEELQVAIDAARNQFAEMRANQIDGILDNGHEVFVPGDDGQPVKGVVTGYDAVEGQYMVETEKPVGGNVVQPFAANQVTSALQEGTENIGGADGQSGETANPESDVPTNDGSNVADGNNAVQETKSTENITAVSPENNNFATAQPTTTVDSEARGAETPAQPEQVNETQQLGQDTQMQESAPTADAPQTAMSRIPVAKDAQGNAIIDKKTGVPAYRWHEASVEDTAEALAELNEGSLINARDTAQDMEVVTNDRLTKLRKRKAVGGDPISISRSRQQNRLEVEDAEKELAHWRSVKDEINRRMTAATAQRLQAEEAAKSEEQKAAEAEAKRKTQEAYDKREREQIAAAIKTENVKRNKEYPPLVAARKAYADDPEAMEVLSDTEPRDLEETVSSLLKPHSMLWSDTDRGGFAVRGLKSELGLQVGDMRRFMNLIGTVESGAKSVSEVAEDIWANMPEGMQDRYTDHDVKNVILDLFGLDNSSKMLNVAAENRIAQAREVYEYNLQREEEAALMAYAEAHHIRPDEVEDFKDWLEQTFPDIIIDEETLARLDEIFAEQLIEQEEYERSHGMGGRPESTGVDRGGQEGQGVVRQQGTAEPGVDTGTAEEGEKQGTAEPDAGQAVFSDGVSVQEGARGVEASHTEEPTEPRPIGKDTQSSDTKQGNDEKSLLGIAISDYLDAYARWGGNIDDNSLHDEYKNARDMLLNLLEEESDESLERLVKDSPDDVVKVVMAVRQSRAEAREGIGIHARWLDEHGRIERVSKKNNVGPLSFVAPPAYVSHPILHGVLHDGGMVVGSDGEVLMAERLPYDAGLEGEVTDRRGNIIEGRYPNWRRVLRSVGKPLGADLYDLESWTNGVYALLKRDKVKKAKQDETLVSLRDTEGKVHFYKLGTLSRVVPGARAIGAEGLMVNPENMLFANTEEGSVIAMPRVMPDGYAEGFAYDGGGGIEKQRLDEEYKKLSDEEEKPSDSDGTRYRYFDEEVNEQFNEALQKQIDGILPKGYVYNLGMPNDILHSAGIPNLPIELVASRLSDKAMQENHPFDLAEVKDLPHAIQNPLAVFRSATHIGSNVILTNLKHGGRNYVVAVETNRRAGKIYVNSVRSVHYRNSLNIIGWINDGLADYISDDFRNDWVEEKKNELLSKPQYNSVDVRKKLISAAKIVKDFVNPVMKGENLSRDGAGTLSDDELSMNNDPVAKMLGKSTRTARQRGEFADRQRKSMTARVMELAATLHLDNVKIVTDVAELSGKRARSKGFYNPQKGVITIVIPNHRSVQDVEQTLLHEAVAHYGLRQLFGKQFDTFLDNVFQHADPEIRREIVALAAKRGWDFRTATEEYLAGLAEDTNFEKMPATFWMKIKRLFIDMLHGLGFEGWQGPELGDNELRYLLWRSYENLKEPGRYRSILGEAADVAKQYELKVGNYEEAGHRHGMAVNGTEGVNGVKAAEKENVVKPGAWGKRDLLSKAEQVSNGIDADLLFRDSIEDDNNTARATYNAWADASMQIVREAWQDSMINVRNLQKAVLDQRGEKLEDWEDAYNEENRSHGRSRAESEYFGDNLYKPLLEAVNQAAKAAKVSVGDVVEYMMAKHGLERNRVFAERDAKVAWEAYRQKKEEAFAEYQAAHKKGRKTLEDFMEKSYEDFLAQKRERDYSGLTALTGVEDVQEAEAEARGIVEDMEEKAGADSIRVLWDRTNAATKWTLRKAYESGVVSKDNYEHVRDMFAYYIPLRGWDENTAADIYDYVGSGDNGNVFSPTLHTAKGRGSRADNPLAYIGSMAVSAIVEGNKNKVKQSFMRFVENHPTNLVTVSEMWYVNDGTAEAPVWREDVPDIPEDATADDVARIVREHEEAMKQKEEQGLATKKRGGLHLRVPVKKGEALEHHVEVLVNGKKYVLYINGNPRAAQALNGTRARRASARSVESNWIGRLNRWLGQSYTSLSPAFAARNAPRDLTMALITTAIKEDPAYAMLFRLNVARLGGPVRMFTLMRWYNDYVSEHGLTPPEGVSRTKRYFYEFITQGSETGYTSLKEIDDYKKDMEKLYDNMNRKIYNPMRLMRDLAGGLEYANRCIEDMTRFATYMTSRERGRSIRESTSDAKNITLNFNRKGSGELGNATYRNLQIFVNPSIQSLQNVASIARHHPVKFTLYTGLVSLVGFAMPLATQLLWSVFGGDGDDDGWNAVDEYWKLPSWQRRNNFVIWIPGTRKFAMIALAQEYRVFHGFGETVMSVLSGHDGGSPWLELASQALDLLPLDVMGNGGNPLVNFAPTVVQPALQVSFNSDFTGRPLYKDTEYNKDEPAFQKAYVGTPSWLVSSSELLNDVTGGNAHRQGLLEQVPIVGNLNNPAVVDHLMKGYLGGIYTFLAQLGSVGWTLASGESPTVHDVPVANALVTAPREREQSGKVALPEWYYAMQQENQQWQTERRGFKRDYLSGDSAAKAQWERLEGRRDQRGRQIHVGGIVHQESGQCAVEE
jgi:hypothetical protein